MNKTLGAAALLLLLALVGACDRDAAAQNEPTSRVSTMEPTDGLTAFRSEAELRRFLQARTRNASDRRAEYSDDAVAVATPPAASVAQEAPAGQDGVTNTQEVGVDEGGIVKRRGDLLVILRRGRLFTVSTAGGDLRAVDSIDAFPPGVAPNNDWYDEMLVSGDRVIVVGYSYGRGGTEVNRFRLSPDGRLSFEDAHHLKSNDYYSSRNYATRLIGNRLILYTPLYLSWERDPIEALPGLRRWTGDAEAPWRPTASAGRIYVSARDRADPDAAVDTLHTVTTCDLSAPTLSCEATGVLGAESRNFYVSPRAVYVWLTGRGADGEPAPAAVTRLPLDGGRPATAGVRGAPVDQFSFREDAADGVLNVLVRSDGGGDAMWSPEFGEGAVALLRLPLRAFGDDRGEVGRERYRPLPAPGRQAWTLRNRFVGRWLLYGGGDGGSADGGGQQRAFAVPLGGGRVAELPTPHAVDRIEAMGPDALLVGGADGDLMLSAVELSDGGGPRLSTPWTVRRAQEAESRSHGFYYRPDDASGARGVLGLPITRPRGAGLLFLRRADRAFSGLGELTSRGETSADDGCRVSCVDWYGNARPLFLGERTFALMGYELVEGRIGAGAVAEVRRLDFTPQRRRG